MKFIKTIIYLVLFIGFSYFLISLDDLWKKDSRSDFYLKNEISKKLNNKYKNFNSIIEQLLPLVKDKSKNNIILNGDLVIWDIQQKNLKNIYLSKNNSNSVTIFIIYPPKIFNYGKYSVSQRKAYIKKSNVAVFSYPEKEQIGYFQIEQEPRSQREYNDNTKDLDEIPGDPDINKWLNLYHDLSNYQNHEIHYHTNGDIFII